MKKYMKVCNKLIEELGKKAGKARIKKADEECLARLRVKYQREALEERRRNRGRKRKRSLTNLVVAAFKDKPNLDTTFFAIIQKTNRSLAANLVLKAFAFLAYHLPQTHWAIHTLS